MSRHFSLLQMENLNIHCMIKYEKIPCTFERWSNAVRCAFPLTQERIHVVSLNIMLIMMKFYGRISAKSEYYTEDAMNDITW